MGEFDLDPCGAPGHVLAKRTYLPENGHDGLILPWEGRVWMNPPFSRAKPLAGFVRKMSEHRHGTALLPMWTDTDIWEEFVWSTASAVLVLRRRVRFLNADGSRSAGAPHATALVAYGKADADQLQRSGIAGQFIRL